MLNELNAERMLNNMAIKDLPTFVVLDIQQLILQSSDYANSVALASAGIKPRAPGGRYSRDYPEPKMVTKNGSESIKALNNWYVSNIKPIQTLKTDRTSLNWVYSKSNWENNFFAIRSYLVTVLLAGDPVLTSYDEAWLLFKSITGKWNARFK